MLMGGIVVEDDVDDLAGRHLGLDGVEKADELLMPMTLHVAADDLAVEHVECGEQRRRAVPLVVVRHGPGAALLHGQTRLGAVERLNLALLVDRQDDGVGRRIDIKPDDVAQLVDELGIVGELELADPMRLEPVRAPDALDRADAEMPATFAIIAPVQCVVSTGGSSASERRRARRPRRQAERCARAAFCREAGRRSPLP